MAPGGGGVVATGVRVTSGQMSSLRRVRRALAFRDELILVLRLPGVTISALEAPP